MLVPCPVVDMAGGMVLVLGAVLDMLGGHVLVLIPVVDMAGGMVLVHFVLVVHFDALAHCLQPCMGAWLDKWMTTE